jgi:hypothetical protein
LDCIVDNSKKAPSLTAFLQVRFALSSSPVFSRTDTVTDSEFFYNLVVDLLEDESEREEVADLLKWWNRCGSLLHHPGEGY